MWTNASTIGQILSFEHIVLMEKEKALFDELLVLRYYSGKPPTLPLVIAPTGDLVFPIHV